jgi:hypothetical protein
METKQTAVSINTQQSFSGSWAGAHPQERTGPRVVTEEHHARVEDEVAAVARHHVNVVGETVVGWVGTEPLWQELDEGLPQGTRTQQHPLYASCPG